MEGKRSFDYGIFIVVLFLLAIGVVMVYSASFAFALYYFNDSHYFLIRQVIWAGLGLIVMLIVSKINYKVWGKLSGIIYFISIVLLILVLIPHIGVEKKGAQRWINLGFMEFQPSEIAKLAMIIFFSYKLSKVRDTIKSFFNGLLPYLIHIGIIAGLILLEPHMSSTVVVVLIGLIMLFTAGARIWHFILISFPVIGGGVLAIIMEPYRLKRLTAFLDPWSDTQGSGWQIIQSLYAIGSGGLFGLGLGQSRQKYLYIPEPHNDFIFSILAEEMGYVGVLVVLILFLFFIWRGFKIAMQVPDTFGSLLATGITSLIGLQVLINIAVVTSSMPVTGVPLPFFSYGGSSLLLLMAGVGILLNISRTVPVQR